MSSSRIDRPNYFEDPAYMNSSDLFSHRYEPEVVSDTLRDSEPVQLPTFSDRPTSDSATKTPPS
ncbi:hypothetical protein [Mycobacterium sp. 1245805.9]|uniref:hypothetical protein n=1 Tax=Mycobacterium sp. 1245805.9 TaxID=1856862 RepID=UPI0012E9A50E|nr:hypothetical protein [Mycobacterium sp. 1245805.9]